MAAVTFDTLKFVETLKGAGVPETQAKAFSTAVQESHEAAELATKADLREYESTIRSDLEKLEVGLSHEIGNLRHETKQDIAELRHEIGDLRKDMDVRFAGVDARLEKMKFELLKWLIGLAVAQAGLLISLLKFFPSSS